MPYDQRYESDLLRGVENSRPWNLLDIIRKYTKKSDLLLDIGCGTASKLLQLAEDVEKIYGLEPNEKMKTKAEKNIKKAGISNIILVDGQADKIPFKDNYFDVVTCMVAPHDTAEVYRILKPNGYGIFEKIGDRDKWNFKQEFNSKEDEIRGQFSHLADGERAKNYKKEFGKLFSDVTVQNGFWNTFYSMDGLLLLLEQTPTIRGFDREADNEAFQKIQGKYMTPQGLKTIQNRILIISRK